jgi:hypothetical protein
MAKKENMDKYSGWREEHFGKGGREGTKAEFEMVCEVRERFEAMAAARRTSCYWGDSDNDTSTAGGDWNTHWDNCDKVKLMWGIMSGFNGQSNVKSPMTSGRINAFINKNKKLHFAYDAFPNNDKDRNSALVAGKTLNYAWKNTDSHNQYMLASEDRATYGSGFYREHYVVEKGEFRFPKIRNLSKDEEQKVKDGEVIYGEKEEVVITDSPQMTYVPIRELYWDPTARCVHGPAYAARDVIWRRVIPLDAAKDILKGIKGAKNIDKIKAGTAYVLDKSDEGFFTPPEDTMSGEYVEWLEYENPRKDQYRIVVNDIPVLDIPMPLNHKEITFHKLDYKKVPGQFYSRGIPDDLLNIQGAEEILANLTTDYIIRAIKTKWMIGSSIAGEVDDEALSDDSNIMVVDDSLGLDIRTKIQQITMQPINFDLFRLIDIYEKQATIASGIDPSQLSVLASGKTATATLQNKEQLESTIGGVIDNDVEGALKDSGRQRWANIRQMWKLPKIKRIIGEENEPNTKREIRLEGVEIKLNDQTNELDVKPSSREYTHFDVSGYLDTKDELEIRIRPDSVDIDSKSLREQRARENLAQLAQFMVDPRNTMQMMQHPYPYINGPKWLSGHANELGIRNDELIQPDVHEDLAKKNAEDDVMRILRGEEVPGQPGVSEAHRKYEAQVAFGIQSRIQELQDSIDSQIQEQLAMAQPTIDPLTGQEIESPAPQADPAAQAELDKINKIYMKLLRHLSTDNLPIGVMEDVAAKPPGAGGGQAQPSPMGKPISVPMPGQPAMSPSGSTGMPSNMEPQIQGGLGNSMG